MSSHPITPAHALPKLALPRASSLAWPVAALVLLAGMHLSNALGRAINWDEFFHYSQIHDLIAGRLNTPMQSLLARAFSWVTLMPGGNIDQILAARSVIFGFVLLGAGATYALALGFAERRVALVCALAWLSAGFVLQHATSYRTDAIAAALLMTSLAIMNRSRLDLRASLAVAALAALAALLTIKSVLYAPAFAGIAWLRWQEAGRTHAAGLKLAVLALQVPALFGLFYLLHASFLPGTHDSGAMVTGSAGKMFQPFTIPREAHALKAAMTAPLLTLAIAISPLLIWRDSRLSGHERVALAGLLLPITTVLFYQNSFAYYYVFILPPVAVGCLAAFRVLIARYSLLAVSAALTLSGLGVWLTEDRATQDRQRQLLAAADQIFPQPVAYFDFSGMIGHFPKANAFLTHWGAESYRNGLYDTMEATMARRAVPLVVANNESLADTLRTSAEVPALLASDVAAIRDSYVHFWGPYWLAGEDIAAGESLTAAIRVPGPYTVRRGSVSVDGMVYLPGEVIELERGDHALAAFSDPGQLIWGERLAEPDMPPPAEPFFTSF